MRTLSRNAHAMFNRGELKTARHAGKPYDLQHMSKSESVRVNVDDTCIYRVSIVQKLVTVER